MDGDADNHRAYSGEEVKPKANESPLLEQGIDIDPDSKNLEFIKKTLMKLLGKGLS
jgi:hypothetical protein